MKQIASITMCRAGRHSSRRFQLRVNGKMIPMGGAERFSGGSGDARAQADESMRRYASRNGLDCVFVEESITESLNTLWTRRYELQPLGARGACSACGGGGIVRESHGAGGAPEALVCECQPEQGGAL